MILLRTFSKLLHLEELLLLFLLLPMLHHHSQPRVLLQVMLHLLYLKQHQHQLHHRQKGQLHRLAIRHHNCIKDLKFSRQSDLNLLRQTVMHLHLHLHRRQVNSYEDLHNTILLRQEVTLFQDGMLLRQVRFSSISKHHHLSQYQEVLLPLIPMLPDKAFLKINHMDSLVEYNKDLHQDNLIFSNHLSKLQLRLLLLQK